MGLISFIKTSGDRIFGKSEEKNDQDKAGLVAAHIRKFGFDTNDIRIKVDNEKVILAGSIDTLENKNKIIVAAGNIEGISMVDDWIVLRQQPVITPPAPEKQFYTVKKGDYLSKISREVYGDPSKYHIIFEANKPMLKDPNLIYPGQMLIIPPLDK